LESTLERLPESSGEEGSIFAHVIDHLGVEPLVRFDCYPSLVKRCHTSSR